MKLGYTDRAQRTLDSLPLPIRKAFHKQTDFLVENLHHPSLRAKKYDEAEDIWQARINRSWRFYFVIEGDMYIIVDLIPHPK